MARLVALGGPIRASDTTLPEKAGWRGHFCPTPDVGVIVNVKNAGAALIATNCVALKCADGTTCECVVDNMFVRRNVFACLTDWPAFQKKRKKLKRNSNNA